MSKFGVSLEEVTNDLADRVGNANQFMTSEYSEDWAMAERYFKGESDVPYDEGRSSLVKTETRDIIRALMPSIMRTLLHARKPVEYFPSNIKQAGFVEQQAMWVTQEFWKNDGYMQLYSAVMESLLHKGGPIKCYWEENPIPQAFRVTNLTEVEVLQYTEHPDVVVQKIEEHKFPKNSPFEGTVTYDIEAVRYYENGRLRIEAFPMYEFFCERNANDLEDFVHGHRRLTTVGEAIAMGLEYQNWAELDAEDPEQNDAAAAVVAKKGFSKQGVDMKSPDPLARQILLTEAYAKYDLDGDGVSECYCFYLGGTQYKYLAHERVEEFCIDVVRHDPLSFSVLGRSVPDITKASQDTMTSLLRTVIDNGHIANNPRVAGDPARADFSDVMNNAIGAPIKTKGKPELQVFDIPFTAGGLLPVLQYLQMDSEQRMGVTKAATGLDPDAMQSTDKNAVMNTIQLSQGQVELIVRNIIETALIPVFRKMLRLSMRHMAPIQMLRFKGAVVPIDISQFGPDLHAEPAVGLGTAAPEQKLQTLGFIYGEQQKYMEKFGLDNPFVSLSQMYNTIEDIVELGGIPNVGRYFNMVDKEAEAVIAKALADQARAAAEEAAKNAPMDPSKALLQIEEGKARIEELKITAKLREVALQLQSKALTEAEKIDLDRDRMALERTLEFARLRREDLGMKVKGEQDATKPKTAADNGQSTPKSGMSTPTLQ